MADAVSEAIVDSGVVDAVVVAAGTPEVADAAETEVAVLAVAEPAGTGSTPPPTLDNPEGLADGFEDAVDIGKFEAAADAEVTAPAASNGAAADKFVTGSNKVLTELSSPVTGSEVVVGVLAGLAGFAEETVEVFAGEMGSAAGTGVPDAVPEVVTAEADPTVDEIDADDGLVTGGASVVVVDGVAVTG